MSRTLLLFIPLILFCLHTQAQHEVYNDGGLLHANKNAIIHINGEIENKTGSTTLNDGVIEITGNLTNDSLAIMANGADSTSTERVYKFVGAGKQAIRGNFSDTSSRYLYNVIVDKSTSGSVVEMQTNAFVKGSLIFGSSTTGSATYTPTGASVLTDHSNRGIIRTFDLVNKDYELYITNPAIDAIKGYAPLAISAAPTDGYIVNRGAQAAGKGGLARNVSQTGSPYVFPVGSDLNGYNAAAITFSSIATGTDKVRGMFVDATGGIGTLGRYYGAGSGNDTSALGFHYYFNTNSCDANRPKLLALTVLPQDHGYWSYAGNASDVYSVEMYPNSIFGGGATTSTWRIIKKTGSIDSVPSGDWTPDILSTISTPANLLTYTTQTGCYPGSGIPGGQYTGFSNFQIISSSANSSLPIVLISLTAWPVDNKFISLSWLTAQEINNKGFEILRSENGIDFQKADWVAAQGGGNSAVGFEYGFDDHNVQPGVVYYYKLNQTDQDGTVTPTYVVQAQIGGEDITTVSDFFPNPAVSISQIAIHSPANASFVAELYNMTGQMIQRAVIHAPSGNSRFELSIQDLPSGTYKAVIKSDSNVFIKSLNIIR
ncbi:MAG: lipoprotein [Bacteroidetes bacterium]|nr:lipoprotein [Bacteroidota bacterium]